MKKKYAFLFAILITLLIASDIYLISIVNKPKATMVFLSRVIDGDTIKLSDGRTLRLLNINAPEKSDSLSTLSKNFLKSFENKSILAEITGTDKYRRNLARIYSLNNEYLNLELVALGFSSKFLVQDSETSLFDNAEKSAVSNYLGIWKKSPYSNCLKAEIKEKEEIVILTNNCNLSKINNWRIKDESRKIYYLNNLSSSQIRLHSGIGKDNASDKYWNSKEDIWNNDKDSIYIFDENNLLVFSDSYGY